MTPAPPSSAPARRLLHHRPAAREGLGGRPLRRAADAVRARALGRRARPPEAQVGHAHLREDRRQARLPLLRRRRARRARHARGAARALPRGRLRGRHRRRQPARDPGRGPARLALGHRVRRLVQRPPRLPRARVRPLRRARGGDRQRQRGDRRRAHARARPGRARADRHRRPRDRRTSAARPSTRSILLGRRGPAQAAFTNPEVRELGELAPRRRRSATRRRSRTRHGERRDADRPSATSRCSATTPRASRRASRTASSCASCARRWRSSARARTAP